MNVVPRAVVWWTSVVLAVAWGAEGVAAPPRFLAAREILLFYQVSTGGELTGRHLWVSTDDGTEWRRADVELRGLDSLVYAAPADGKYQLYLVLENAAGTSGPPPGPDVPPTTTVVIDTAPPLLQIDAANVQTPAGGSPVVQFDAKLIEENLAPEGVRLFYRQAGDDGWQDGGPVNATPPFEWTPPESVRGPLRVKLVATDRAGNQTGSKPREIEIPRAVEPPTPVTMPKTPGATPDAVTVEMTTIVPVEVAPPGIDAPNAAKSHNAESRDVPLDRLQVLAQELMSRGDYALAAAQLKNALEGSPKNADLLVDLGSALYRLGRYDDAESRFASAHELTPTHAGALEGLALVAATEKRYRDARTHLVRLLEMTPDSGENWMRLGDVEHRLGRRNEALEAWRKALGLPTVPPEVARQAERRLQYFDRRSPAERSADQQWQQTGNSRRSSSSSATKSTRSP